MKSFKLALSGLKRDWHFGELHLIGIAIVIAVACLTSVNFFTDRVRKATAEQATELLAADLVLVSSAPISAQYIQRAIAAKLDYSLNESFRSVVVKDDLLELAEIKAVDPNYPIRGHLKTSDALFAAETINHHIPKPGTVWLDNRLLQALQVQIGETIELGASTLLVAKVLTYEPDRGGDLFNIAPRLLMNRINLDATGLILPGSQIRYKLLLGGDSKTVDRYHQQLKDRKPDNIRVQDIKETRPEIRAALERADQFLNLAALVSVALAGLAIAMSAQRYAIRHYDNCAIMRCLGLQQRQITEIYLFQLILLALLCSLIGCGIGYFAQEVLNKLMVGMVKGDLPAPSLRPLLSGLLAGLVAVLAFALPQLLHLKNVSPLRVLRRDLTPLPVNHYLIYLIATAALLLLSPWQAGNIRLTGTVLFGLLITVIALAVAAKLLIKTVQFILPRLKTNTYYGIATIARRSKQSIIQIIGIGIGVTVILLLTLVRTDLLTNWQNRLPATTPNYFLINIQADQVQTVQQFLSTSLAQTVQLHPMIRARLIKINQQSVKPEAYASSRAERLARREFNLSYTDTMQTDNRLVAGTWWPSDRQDQHYFSVEEGIAKTLGIKQGDSLTYLIAGQELTGTVINLRWVEWDSFNVNFFVVTNPEALKNYASTFISNFYLAETKRAILIDLIKQFPSITVLDVDALVKQIRLIMEQVVQTIQFVFIFTLLTGLAILFAALQATHDERRQEAALMRALGASQKQIMGRLIAEFFCLGLVTGLLSAFAASCIELLLAEFVLKIGIVINPWIWVVAPLVCCSIVITIGLIGTRKVLSTPPMLVLRGGR